MIEAYGYDGGIWTGSGFYVSEDGKLITNYHVIVGAESLTIVHDNNEEYSGEVRVLAYSEEDDIAVLDINRKVDLYIEIGDSDKVRLGERIYTIGSPVGLKNTLSEGIVSSIRDIGFQITAPISPGSSGGVLVNTKGEAIGITNAGIPGGENLGFAIPINKYVELPQIHNYSLSEFYDSIRKDFRPETLVLTRDKEYPNSFNIYWSEVPGAYYYKIYYGYSLDSLIYEVYNQYGDNEWYYCDEGQSFNVENAGTYYFAVTAVKNDMESLPSDVKWIYLESPLYTMDFEEYETYLLETYGAIFLNNEHVFIDIVSVEELNGTLSATLLFNYYSLHSFTEMVYKDKETVKDYMLDIVVELSDYYQRDANLKLVYYDYVDNYPSDFDTNMIDSDTVAYDSYLEEWEINYPFLSIEYNYDAQYYDTMWDGYWFSIGY